MSRASKLLSRVLRHEPGAAGLTLGPGGWVGLDDLVRGLRRAGHRDLDRAVVLGLMAGDDKRRFTLSPDGRRVRAAQGHSVDVDLGLPLLAPPPELFHGTASAGLHAIFAEGLRPGRRRHVHLSPDEATALRVGQRHGRAVVLRVDAGAMHEEGHPFWQADNGVWLTDAVPPRFLAVG